MIDEGGPRLRRDQLFGSEPIRSGPAVGDRFPAFDLATTDGPRIRSRDLAGRPALIALASCTCPVAERAGPVIRRLYGAFGDRVSFLTVYVREAYPSRRYMQPTTFEQKFDFAKDYRMRHRIPWTLAVDDVVGTLQRAIGGRPSSAYLLDGNGRVVRSVADSSDASQLRLGLEEVLAGVRPIPSRIPRREPASTGPPGPATSRPEVRPPTVVAPAFAPPERVAGTISAATLIAGALVLAAGWIAWRLLDPER